MPLPHKDYYALTEIEQRWGMRRLDSAYFAENGRIELAIRTHELDLVTAPQGGTRLPRPGRGGEAHAQGLFASSLLTNGLHLPTRRPRSRSSGPPALARHRLPDRCLPPRPSSSTSRPA